MALVEESGSPRTPEASAAAGLVITVRKLGDGGVIRRSACRPDIGYHHPWAVAQGMVPVMS